MLVLHWVWNHGTQIVAGLGGLEIFIQTLGTLTGNTEILAISTFLAKLISAFPGTKNLKSLKRK